MCVRCDEWDRYMDMMAWMVSERGPDGMCVCVGVGRVSGCREGEWVV